MKIISGLFLMVLAGSVMAQVHVKGYSKKDGTYVEPHEKTSPNSTKLDNYSTKGNVNPYTGKEGTVDPQSPPPPPVKLKPLPGNKF